MLTPDTAVQNVRVAIIGSGFSGLGMAIRLRQTQQEDFVILEKETGVGGTWRVNHYPGCACDVQSHLYSFSFEMNPNWTRMFAPQAEIKQYLERCWHKYNLPAKTQFGCEIRSMHWHEDSQRWLLTAADGRRFSAQFVVSGMGALSIPAIPALPGLETFQGERFHSQDWNHDYDLRGKRVAVIGTGASAIQFVPKVQQQAAQLDLYQRTPPWIMPKPDRDISLNEQRRFSRWPWLQKLWRGGLYSLLESRVLGFTVTPKMMKVVEWVARRHLRQQVADPALRRKLTPSYTIGCKRILLSNDYYPALAQANVSVLDSGIAEIRAHSIVDQQGVERPVDALIFGTGFTPNDPIPRGSVFGRGGLDLVDTWPNGPEAYKGTMSQGFPNLFFLMGPNTGLGHNSMVYMIESQIHYVLQALAHVSNTGVASLDPKPEVQQRFNQQLQGQLGPTVWNSGGCNSWYLHPETGRNCTVWPGFTWRYRQITRAFDAEAYRFARAPLTTPSKIQAQEVPA
ncbi:flavin-containing monooxygenase [Atopomonas sediminilitoris]|uniref:flavin-containing monooxygenase n=1 Tax=Atopomonas sediminilitoris TaxID=2919919 RepID=UPI001F4E8D02|nr:NAD(P)/FAD-dependent oxidoreductase [Atopomonas sediminilitoris]MCJ8168147.1 NAD(P)/FAD-dependent oxidoreductase [Atopomonas sediminilitoris]